MSTTTRSSWPEACSTWSAPRAVATSPSIDADGGHEQREHARDEREHQPRRQRGWARCRRAGSVGTADTSLSYRHVRAEVESHALPDRGCGADRRRRAGHAPARHRGGPAPRARGDRRRGRRGGLGALPRAAAPTSSSPTGTCPRWTAPSSSGASGREARSPYAYVLVLTGVAGEEAAREVMEAGADDLIAKPLDAAELERKLIAAARVTELHRRLHADARQDALTGVGNRLRLDEDLVALCGARRALRAQLLRRDVRRGRLQGLQRRARPSGRRRRAAGRRRGAGRRRARRRPAVPLRRRGVRAAAGRAVAGGGHGGRASACARRSRRSPSRTRRRRADRQRRRRGHRGQRLRPGQAARGGRRGALRRQGGGPQPGARRSRRPRRPCGCSSPTTTPRSGSRWAR